MEMEMDQEVIDRDPEIPAGPIPSPADPSLEPESELETSSVDPSLGRSASFSRLNAGAPEFVPRAATPQSPAASSAAGARIVKIHHGHGQHPASPPVMHVYHPASQTPFLSPVVGSAGFEYFGGGGGYGEGFGEQEVMQAVDQGVDQVPVAKGLSEEVIHRITKQVEYYFSDANLATTEHLMRFINKDPDGFVPITVIASFKKIKTLVQNNSLLATALRSSSKLFVSEDGKKVKRLQPFTDADVEELQSRTIVAENLPEDHCYQNLMKIFSSVGSVKTIRTCYPQTPNGSAAATNRSAKMDLLFGNKLHAFVEYETVGDAEKAVAELNDERNWSGLRVRLLLKCMNNKHGSGRGRKGGHEGDGTGEEDDVSTSDQLHEKQGEDVSQPSEAWNELVGEDSSEREGGGRRGRGRGRGGKGRGRGHYHSNNRSGGHPAGTPPSSYPIHSDQPGVAKQPPGPRMPDGTKGFTMGRGKQLTPSNTG